MKGCGLARIRQEALARADRSGGGLGPGPPRTGGPAGKDARFEEPEKRALPGLVRLAGAARPRCAEEAAPGIRLPYSAPLLDRPRIPCP